MAIGISEQDINAAMQQISVGKVGGLNSLKPEEFTAVQKIIESMVNYDIQDDLVIKSPRGVWVLENRGKLTYPELQAIALKITKDSMPLNDMTITEWKKFKTDVKSAQPKSTRGGIDPTIVSLVSRMRTRKFDDLTDYEYSKAIIIAQMLEAREATSENREAYIERLLNEGVPWAAIQLSLGTISGLGLANYLDLSEEQWYNFKQDISGPLETEPKKVLRKFNFDE